MADTSLVPSKDATAIADSYLASLPDGYASRYSALGDEATIHTLLDAAEHGLNDKSCCEAAGISTRTLTRWHAEAAADPSSAHGLFVDALKTARARGKLALLGKIKAAADKPQFWTAAAWTLERTDPEQFALRKDNADGPKVVVQIGAGAGDVQVAVAVVSPPRIESGSESL